MQKITDNIVHICFSQSAGGSLKHAVNKKKLFEGKKIILGLFMNSNSMVITVKTHIEFEFIQFLY